MPESASQFNPENDYTATLPTETVKPETKKDEDESEIEIIKKAQAGDQKAFDKLYEKYHKKLKFFIIKKTRSEQDAEDIVQTTWRKAFEKINTFADKNFSSWIFTIANNTFLDEMRRKKTNKIEPNTENILNWLPDQKSTADYGYKHPIEQKIDNLIMGEKLDEAIKELSKRDQMVVRARMRGEEFQDIAKKIGEKTGTTKSIINRAKIKLMTALKNWD